MNDIPDPRKQCYYTIDEIVFGAISLFLFKSGSRNNYNNFRATGKFRKNFQKVFARKLPSMDAVADVLKQLQENDLETLKIQLVKTLISKKVFHKMRFYGKYLVAIDATGIATYKERHCSDCLYTESKKGVKTYYHKVLEAKLVTENGFSISLCTVWIDNEDTNNGIYDKQGCEQKAFKKLAVKLKKDFPRLPICLCADGLYPNNSFFKICTTNKWDYLVTLKEGNLKGFWEKIRLQNRECKKHSYKAQSVEYKQTIQWINDKEHNGYVHNWIQCDEIKITSKNEEFSRFVHLTNLKVDQENCIKISDAARLRWKIEKQGFDQQKNHGYNIEHKFCRKSYLGMKNYYQCCQIAHIINQLIELNNDFKDVNQGKMTVMFLWELMRASLVLLSVDVLDIEKILERRHQIQYNDY